MMRKLLFALAFLAAAPALAQMPQTLHYQGYLTTSAGAPVNGATPLTFKLYAAAAGGSALWSETHAAVNVANGNYQVILGNTTPFGLDFSAPYWLGVTVGADAEMAPRQALSMAPYAHRAVVADSLAAGATVPGSQVTGTIAGATLSGSTLAQLQGQFIGVLQPTSVAANTLNAVDSAGNVGRYPSIAIGADGLPVIAYNDNNSIVLNVAKCANAACTAGTSTHSIVDSAGFVGEHTSIAIGTDGLPVIAYYDGTNFNLKVAKCVNAACTTGTSTLSTVDNSAGDVGQYTSIAIGADGLPVIAYHDVTNFDLKVAKCVNAACTGESTLSIVDEAGNVGAFASIAIGADGLPVIAYYDNTSFDLNVAKCVNAACTGESTISTVDAPANVGMYTSIAIGADGLPVIAYWDLTNFDLKVAKCTNAACTAGTSTLSIVDSAGNVGSRASLSIGADGLPVIAYYDLTNGDLKVAKCANAACTAGTSTLSTVDSTGDVGQFISIAIGADGLPVIAYWNATNLDLKVAKCANVFCAPYVWRR
jgi:hypothetical protein